MKSKASTTIALKIIVIIKLNNQAMFVIIIFSSSTQPLMHCCHVTMNVSVWLNDFVHEISLPVLSIIEYH